jgi:hypothetical protein
MRLSRCCSDAADLGRRSRKATRERKKNDKNEIENANEDEK